MTYLTNYGTNSPKHPHHRANEPVRGGTTKGLIGALVGGPNNKDQYVDDVNSYEYTEVALDYNAVFLLGCSGSSYVSRNSEPTTIPTTATITTAPSGTISPTTPSASVSPTNTATTSTSPAATSSITPTPSVSITPTQSTTSPQPSTSVSVATSEKLTVNYQILSDWGNGATINVMLNNKGPIVNGWKLSFTFPGNQKITTMWNAKYTQNGNPVSATNEYYNSLIPTNSSVVLGFNISYSGTKFIPRIKSKLEPFE